MHVMMTKEQFDMLKQKAKSGGGEDKEKKEDKDKKGNGGGEEKLPKIEVKEEDDTHGLIKTDDVDVNYFYNASEGRLSFGPSKRKTLAAYCAGDNIIGTFIMDTFSKMPNPKAKSGDGGTAKGGDGEGQEKKDQQQLPQQHQEPGQEHHQSQ